MVAVSNTTTWPLLTPSLKTSKSRLSFSLVLQLRTTRFKFYGSLIHDRFTLSLQYGLCERQSCHPIDVILTPS